MYLLVCLVGGVLTLLASPTARKARRRFQRRKRAAQRECIMRARKMFYPNGPSDAWVVCDRFSWTRASLQQPTFTGWFETEDGSRMVQLAATFTRRRVEVRSVSDVRRLTVTRLAS